MSSPFSPHRTFGRSQNLKPRQPSGSLLHGKPACGASLGSSPRRTGNTSPTRKPRPHPLQQLSRRTKDGRSLRCGSHHASQHSRPDSRPARRTQRRRKLRCPRHHGPLRHKTPPYQRHRIPNYGQSDVERNWVEFVAPRGPFAYTAPVVLLVNHWTGSMGEGMAIGFDAMHRAVVVGTPMAHLAGAVSEDKLPQTGAVIAYATEQIFHVDGTPRQNWLPPVLVTPGPNALSPDPIIARGLKELARKTRWPKNSLGSLPSPREGSQQATNRLATRHPRPVSSRPFRPEETTLPHTNSTLQPQAVNLDQASPPNPQQAHRRILGARPSSDPAAPAKP